MQLEEAIYGRRSIRSFKSEDVTEEQIKKILKVGMNAPSGMNAQSWRFVVIKDKEKHKKILKMHPYAQMLETAPVAILVCGDLKSGNIPDMWVMDCSACVQNMLLTIHSLGLGGVWCGVYPDGKVMGNFSKEFNLPEHIKPFSLVVFGHPSEIKEPNDRYSEDWVHYEKW